jgi:ectoine hydroxylase-related dioxygenase (phytanoyl-CoA dioxygenase family)
MKYIYPENVSQTNSLTELQIKKWKENGYLLINGLLEKEILNNAIKEFNILYPQINNQDEIDNIASNQDFGSKGLLEFPCLYDFINQITLSNNIINAAEQLLDEEVRLLQSDAWSKYGGNKIDDSKNNRDQRIHVDYANNTFVHPSSWNKPDAVAMIIYFDDSEVTGGCTAVVPREGDNDPYYKWPLVNNPGVAGLPWENDKDTIEAILKESHPEVYKFRQDLYKKEKFATFKPGTVLFYRHDIWHRGTPVNLGQVRRVVNLGYRRESCDWLTTWNKGWARKMYHETQFVEKLIVNANIRQRNILGFPKPGHKYWTKETLEAVDKRYGPLGFDITPYLKCKL